MDTEALPNGCDRSHIRNGVPSLAETGYRAKLPCRVRDESQTLAQDSRLWVTSSHYSRRKPGPEDTLAIARNLALAAETVHRARHAIGDVNEKNVMVRDGLQAVLPSARPHYRPPWPWNGPLAPCNRKGPGRAGASSFRAGRH